MKLSGRVAIVSGSGRGVGRGIALALAREGAAVCVAELDPETGKATAAELQAAGARALAAQCDVGRPEQIAETVERAASELGRIDILVNNATGARMENTGVPILELSEDHFDRILAIDLKGSFHFMRACFPHLRDGGAGRIVNLCSSAGSERAPGLAPYACAKEALRALTGVVAREWGPYGITANAICPTATTPATEEWMQHNPELAAQTLASKAIGRMGDPEQDIGRAVAFLAGPDAGYITGQTLWLDGGAVISA